jgi:hypothetical protein
LTRFVSAIIIAVLWITFSVVAMAASQTRDDAKTLVKKAVAYLKANGKDRALAEFSNPKGQFVNGELYLTVWDFNGTQIAHGANSKLIGKQLIELKDMDGKAFVKEFMAVGRKGQGWVSYKWTNPATNRIETKQTYLEAANEIIIGAGVYK